MGKKRGFHQPFKQLKTHKPKAPPQSKPQHTASPRKEVSHEDDASLFKSAVAGATPLSDHERVPIPKKPSVPFDDDAQAMEELRALVDGSKPFRIYGEEETISGVAPGVDPGILQKLLAGQVAYRRHIDLHGFTRDDAKQELAAFLRKARYDQEHCVLVVTGRGRRSPGGVSVLKESLPRWLSRAPNRAHVLAFATALPQDGGPGAFYVMLRAMTK